MFNVKIEVVDCCSTPLPDLLSMLSGNKGLMGGIILSFISDKFNNSPGERRNTNILISFLSFCGNPL